MLNQLTHYLGTDVFREGVRRYLQQYAWQAAKLPDFMDTLGVVAGKDLSRWTQDWLYSAGTNSVQADVTCKNGLIERFELLQSASAAHPTLRQHALNVGLYALNGRLQVEHVEPVTIDGARTEIPALRGRVCPDMVYPNHGDPGFVKVLLDERSAKVADKAIALTQDSLLRSMLYQSLWDSVAEYRRTPGEYIETVARTIVTEAGCSGSGCSAG